MFCHCSFNRINHTLCVYIICVLLPFLLLPLAVSPDKASRCAYVLLLVALFWLLQPVPIPVTSLLPIVLFPLLGVLSSAEVCSCYMKESYMLFIGTMIMALAVEECNFHERVAMKILLWIGTEIKWLMLGFLFTSMFLSMWISNTSTTAMMIPMVEAVVAEISGKNNSNHSEMQRKEFPSIDSNNVTSLESEKHQKEGVESDGDNKSSKIKVALMLCICYGSNIGGCGTMTGTPIPVIFKGLLEESFPDCNQITFASYTMYSAPGTLLCVVIGWFCLWFIYMRPSNQNHDQEPNVNIKQALSKRYDDLGPISVHEVQVLILFVILLFLLIFRDPKFVSGWSEAIASGTKIGDSVVAIGVAFLIFFLPARPRDFGGRPILHWKTAEAKFPWGILLLVGGGSSLALATQKSGLSLAIGNTLLFLKVLPPAAIVIVISLMTSSVTELMSNFATASIVMPVLSQMAVSLGINPLYMMLPIPIVSHYAFMLPVGTTTNILVYEKGNLRTIDMVKFGFVMNIVCCSVQMIMLNTLGVAMFDLLTFPAWAIPGNSSSFVNITDV